MTSPVPGSPLVRIMDAPSAIRRSASPRFFAPHTNGTSNWFLSMWYTSSAGAEHFGFVDVVDFNGLQDAGFGNVTDAHLRHDRDGHGFLDALDHGRVAHAGDATGRANVGRNTLERHHRACARVLRDLRLLGG